MASTRFDMTQRNAGWIEQALPINMKLAVPASTAAGDVVLIGELPVYVQTDRDSDGYSIVTLPCTHVQKITVYGKTNAAANSAVAIGDKLYADASDGQINKDTGGEAIGYALETVTSGSSAAILVGFGL